MKDWKDAEQPLAERIESLVDEMGDAQTGFLIEPLRLRISQDAADDLARLEAFFAGRGYLRRASRSQLVRLAIDRLVKELNEAFPDAQKIELPPPR